MSHFKQRKETNCLNCNAEVAGRYCQVCGQENVEPKQSLGHLITHFFNDITHFDGKFFSTLGTLIRRPGHLTAEYTKGRRMSYLDPIRMYIFTSAVFFLLLFGVFHIQDNFKYKNGAGSKGYELGRISAMSDAKLRRFAWENFEDSTLTRQQVRQRLLDKKETDSVSIRRAEKKHNELEQYDSVQQSLSENRRDGWFKHVFKRKTLQIEEASQRDGSQFLSVFFNAFLHRLPQLLFVSLPLFALILKLVYVRRKEFYYTSHGIFAIHLYIFSFINILFQFLVEQVGKWTGLSFLKWIELALFLWIFVYQYKAMRRFYGQSRSKTIAKFFVINFLATLLLAILFIIFLFFSLITAV